MAALRHPHWEAVTPSARNLLERIAKHVALEPFYLAGGTAFALQRGHRISQDLDFFGAIDNFDNAQRQRLVTELGTQFDVKVVRDSLLGLALHVEDVAVSFLTYGYVLLDETHQLEGVEIAGLTDIGLMKMDAITDRGARRDFVALYFLAREIPLDTLFEKAKIKFPYLRHFSINALTALVDFEIAEQQDEPEMLISMEWQDIKNYFRQEAKRIGKKFFEQK